jgi:hypothetical protein
MVAYVIEIRKENSRSEGNFATRFTFSEFMLAVMALKTVKTLSKFSLVDSRSNTKVRKISVGGNLTLTLLTQNH